MHFIKHFSLNTNILITGGTGLIGTALQKHFKDIGYTVAILSRKRNISGTKSFYWNYETGEMDNEAIEFADVIIHLAGENISNKRWSKKQKQKIIDSRVKTTNLLFNKSKIAVNKPKYIISASAVGYYGLQPNSKTFTERDNPGNDFLAQTVVKWENNVNQFEEIGINAVKIRTGIVLSKDGGALPKMLLPIKLGMGAALGTGKQFIPWIELNDLARIFVFVIENRIQNEVYNAVAPNEITNHELTKAIAKCMNKPFFMPNIPSFVFRLLYGEMADIFLKGNKVSSKKIESIGFEFKYKAIDDIFSKKNKSRY